MEESGSLSDGNSSPRRRFLRKRTAGIINVPPAPGETEDDISDSEGGADGVDPLPDVETGIEGKVTVKEALEGLFTSGTVSSSTRDLIVVKRFSQGKTFRQRLAYIIFKHNKTSLFFRYVVFFLTFILVLLYIAEAIFVDVFLWNFYESGEEEVVFPCFNLSRNYRESKPIDLILVPKPIQIWALQTFLAIICLAGACFSVYVRQELHGSIFKHFFRNFDINIFISIVLGLMFIVTLGYPTCLHMLFIPSFLYCWPARFILLIIIRNSNQGSFFRHNTGLRTTVISLSSFMMCFLVSCICVIHHFERLGKQINIFDTYWFTVVTFSTVGYGDVSPGHWTGKVFMILFIVSALVYLPSKLEKLWSSIQLHRKHYSEYQKRSSVKHIILVVMSIKPLVLRDFLNEFYSDPKQMDTQSVLLVETEPDRNIKQLLYLPVWSQRITVLLGSGLKIADLSRAKARSAEACFILTAKTSGSTEEADRHTILTALTLKSYAPRCKQYVHIIRPENKMHLNMADEVICERELTNSLLAMNAICPGMSTVAALLMHTFTYEGRGYNNPDYKHYEKCSPCEIYNIQLSQSRYFHHFSGKNFHFSAVVAYRKFHVVLLGVRPATSSHIMFNPGITYIMKEDDTCYYISETKEEYSDYQVVKPTCFEEGLWNASATIGLLSMYMVGIDPDKFVSPTDNDETDGQKRYFKRIMSMQSERKMSMESLPTSPKRTPSNERVLAPLDDEDIGSLDDQIIAEESNWQEEAHVGVQLLKYHCSSREKKPVVKLNVVPRHCSHSSNKRHSMSTCPNPGYDFRTHTDFDSRTDPAPEIVVVDTLTDEEDIHMKEEFLRRPKPRSQPSVMNLFHRSTSHADHHVAENHHGFERLRKSTSFFKLNLHRGDTAGSLQSIASTVSAKSDSSQHSHLNDPLVVLELDDISEKEELENLEDGRAHDLELPLIDEEEEVPDHSSVVTTPLDTSFETPGMQFIKDQIPVLPYCGCEPLHCYLERQRPLSEIQISSTSVCDQVKFQWHEKAVLVYAERSTPALFHFIAPLRAKYLPEKSLKPIVFILGSLPDKNFISFISDLPLVYFLVGSLKSISDLIKAGIMCAEFLVVLSSSEIHINSNEHESLADAENIAALHKIARLFPHVQMSIDLTYRYNIRFLYTTPYEQWSLQHLRQMARKGDHLTYLFLPQVASGKAFSGNMLDTLLYQAYQKPHIINVFRQLINCHDEEGSGFLWKVSVTEEFLHLSTYVRVFQRLVSTLGYIPIAIYRTSHVATKFDPKDIKGFNEKELENLRIYLQGRLHSLGLSEKVDKLLEPQHQHFVFLNPPPDFTLEKDDIILVIRPPATNSHSTTHHKPAKPTNLLNRSFDLGNIADITSASSYSPTSVTSNPLEMHHFEEEYSSGRGSRGSRPATTTPQKSSRNFFMHPTASRGDSTRSLKMYTSVDTYEL